MIPLFSATKTRPLGANSIEMGSFRPVNAVDSWKPAGRVVAPAPPAPVSASASGGQECEGTARAAPEGERNPCAWLPAPVRGGGPGIGESNRPRVPPPSTAPYASRNEDARTARRPRSRECSRRRPGRRPARPSPRAATPRASPRPTRPGVTASSVVATSQSLPASGLSVAVHGTVTGSGSPATVAVPAACALPVGEAQHGAELQLARHSRRAGRRPSRTSDSCRRDRDVGLVLRAWRGCPAATLNIAKPLEFARHAVGVGRAERERRGPAHRRSAGRMLERRPVEAVRRGARRVGRDERHAQRRRARRDADRRRSSPRRPAPAAATRWRTRASGRSTPSVLVFASWKLRLPSAGTRLVTSHSIHSPGRSGRRRRPRRWSRRACSAT